MGHLSEFVGNKQSPDRPPVINSLPCVHIAMNPKNSEILYVGHPPVVSVKKILKATNRIWVLNPQSRHLFMNENN